MSWEWPDFSFLSRLDDERRQKLMIILIGSIIIVFILFVIPYMWRSLQKSADGWGWPSDRPASQETLPGLAELPAEPKVNWAVPENNLRKLEQVIRETRRFLEQKTRDGYDWGQAPAAMAKAKYSQAFAASQSVRPPPPQRQADWREAGMRLLTLDQGMLRLLQSHTPSAPAVPEFRALELPPPASAQAPAGTAMDWRGLGLDLQNLEHNTRGLLGGMGGDAGAGPPAPQFRRAGAQALDAPPGRAPQTAVADITWRTVGERVLALEKSNNILELPPAATPASAQAPAGTATDWRGPGGDLKNPEHDARGLSGDAGAGPPAPQFRSAGAQALDAPQTAVAAPTWRTVGERVLALEKSSNALLAGPAGLAEDAPR